MACNGEHRFFLNRDLYYKWQDRPDGGDRMVVCEEDDPDCNGGFLAFRKSGQHAAHSLDDDMLLQAGDYIANKRVPDDHDPWDSFKSNPLYLAKVYNS